MDKLLYASYVINLTEEVVSPGQGDIHLFYLLLQTLSYFCYSDLEPELITHVFEIKLLDHIGYRPVLDNCMICGSNKGPYHFDIVEGGLVCTNCFNANRIGNNIQMGTIKTIEYVLDMDMNRMNILKIPSSIMEELDEILKAYIEERIEKRLKSRQFIDDFKGRNRKN
jgi:DNA repair protein RecO (recombination protein O)